MRTLEQLKQDIEDVSGVRDLEIIGIKKQIETILHAQYADWSALQKALENLENGKDVTYEYDEYGDIVMAHRFDGLRDVPEDEREYLESCLEFARPNWDRLTLEASEGDGLVIQDSSGHRFGNGVWLNGKRVIDEYEYRDEETDEVDEAKRNELIEAYMEREGYFPGVFRADPYSNELYPVSTLPKK